MVKAKKPVKLKLLPGNSFYRNYVFRLIFCLTSRPGTKGINFAKATREKLKNLIYLKYSYTLIERRTLKYISLFIK